MCVHTRTHTCSSAHMHIHAQVIYPCMPMWRPEIDTLVYFTEPLLHIIFFLSQGLSLYLQLSISVRLSSHQELNPLLSASPALRLKIYSARHPPFTWYQNSGLNAGIAIPLCPESLLKPLWLYLHTNSIQMWCTQELLILIDP